MRNRLSDKKQYIGQDRSQLDSAYSNSFRNDFFSETMELNYRWVSQYCDLTAGYDFDPDGVACFYDCWLDLIARPACLAHPRGHVREDDRDELEDALRNELCTREQYEAVLSEAERLKRTLFSDLSRLETVCLTLVRELEDRHG